MSAPHGITDLLPYVGGIAAITGALSGALTSALVTHRLAKRREQRGRFIDALRQERAALEGRGDQLDDAAFNWHRASVGRLHGHADALKRLQPGRWARLADDWHGYELPDGQEFATWFLGGGDRSKLLARLDAMMAKLMA